MFFRVFLSKITLRYVKILFWLSHTANIKIRVFFLLNTSVNHECLRYNITKIIFSSTKTKKKIIVGEGEGRGTTPIFYFLSITTTVIMSLEKTHASVWWYGRG